MIKVVNFQNLFLFISNHLDPQSHNQTHIHIPTHRLVTGTWKSFNNSFFICCSTAISNYNVFYRDIVMNHYKLTLQSQRVVLDFFFQRKAFSVVFPLLQKDAILELEGVAYNQIYAVTIFFVSWFGGSADCDFAGIILKLYETWKALAQTSCTTNATYKSLPHSWRSLNGLHQSNWLVEWHSQQAQTTQRPIKPHMLISQKTPPKLMASCEIDWLTYLTDSLST